MMNNGIKEKFLVSAVEIFKLLVERGQGGFGCQFQDASKGWMHNSQKIFYGKIRKDIVFLRYKSAPANTTLCSTIAIKYVHNRGGV